MASRFATLAIVAVLLAVVPLADAGLVAHYSFDDDTATDLSGNANNGVVGTSVTFTSDAAVGGRALETTDRGNTYVTTVPTSASFEAISDELTLSFWMKADLTGQTNWHRIFQHANEGGGTQGWLVDRYNNTDETNIRVDTTGTGGQFNQNLAENENLHVYDGSWHHLVYTLNNGIWEEYLDGVRASGTYNHGDGFANTRPFYISGRNNTAEYIGLLDDVAVWDEQLGVAEARSLYTVPAQLGLDYDVSTMSLLWSTYAGQGSVRLGQDVWTYAGSIPGTPLLGDTFSNARYDYLALGDGDGLLHYTLPEPTSLALLALGGLALRRRRK